LQAARRFYEAALELWPENDDLPPELLLAYARSRVDDGTLDDAVLTDAIEGLLATGRNEDAAEARARLGGMWINRGDRDRALEHLELARKLVAGRGPSPQKTFALQELARALMMANEPRAVDLASESLRLADELGLDASRARNLNTLGCWKVLNGDPSGIEDLERAIEIGTAAGSHEGVSAMANLQTMVSTLGDLRRAGELQERTLTAARRQGVTSFIT
jgi:tetratricopeptide (TPR) repeat protein